MANLQSQIKRNRQNLVRHERNQAVRSMLKTYEKRFREAVAEGDKDLAEEAYHVAARHYDKAASKGVVHKNKAANHKSKMAKKLASM